MVKKGFSCSAVKFCLVLFFVFITGAVTNELKSQASLDSLGSFWSLTPHQSNKDVRVIAADSSGFLYAGIWGEGILRSTDNGANWVDLTNDLTFKNITAIEFDSTGKIYLGTLGGGVFYSSNNGNNWTQANSGLTNLRVTTLKIQKGGPMYVGTVGGGVFRSVNGGLLWTQQNNGLFFWEISAMIINNSGHVIVGTPRDGIYRSTDQGNNWMRSNGSITNRNITSFAKNTIGELVVGTLGGGVCNSVDGGGNWVEIKRSSNCVNVNCVVYASIQSPVAGLADFGLVRYDDQNAEDWVLSNYRSTGVNCIIRTANNTIWAAVPFMGIYKSVNRGQNWSMVSLANNVQNIQIKGGKPNFVISATPAGGVMISSNNGITWYSGGLTDYTVTSFGLDSNGNFLAGVVNKSGAKYGTLYKTTDNGGTWIQLWTKKDTVINVIATNPQGYLFTGLSFPPINPQNPNSIVTELYMTTNNGNTWQHIACKAPTSAGFPFISINYNGDIYLNQDYGLYKSTNLGTDWTQVLNNTVAQATSVGFTTNRNVFVGTDLGIFKSTDHGFMWQTDDFGLQYPAVSQLIITPWNEIIVGLSYSYGFLYSSNAGGSYKKMNYKMNLANLKQVTISNSGFLYATNSSIYRAVSPFALAPPVLDLPAANAEGVEGKPTLSWNAVTNADMYEFQISTDIDFNNIKERGTIGATSYKLRYNLESFTLYYWRVRSRVNSSLGDWAPFRSFTTTVTPPTLISPENKSGSNSVTNLKLLWLKVNGAGIYNVELAKDIDFNYVVYAHETKDTFAIVPSLELYTKYYWRVNGKTFKATGPWSDTWEFFTKLKPPVLRAPAHRSVALPTVVKLEWNNSDGGQKYEVRLAKDSLFVSMVFEGTAENNNEHLTELLENNTVYWWTIRAINDDGMSDWQTPWKFSTVITAPNLVLPADGSEDLKTAQTFEWTGDTAATKYHIQISKDGGFSNFAYNDSNVATVKLPYDKLEYFERYYWRVRKYAGDVPGLWSVVWKINTGLGQTILTSPANNSKDIGNDVMFIWENLKGADEYILELSENVEFTVVPSKITTADTRYEILSLDYDKDYFFRVRGKYSKGQGDWSEIFTFKTKKISDVSEAVTGLSNFEVYPNPTAQSFSIDLMLNEDAETIIGLTNMQGRPVAEIHKGWLNSGSHKIAWISGNLTQGSYLLNLTVNGKTTSKQVIIIK
jgi:photosystem II stability/assembly factor-like uncharacterized protein